MDGEQDLIPTAAADAATVAEPPAPASSAPAGRRRRWLPAWRWEIWALLLVVVWCGGTIGSRPGLATDIGRGFTICILADWASAERRPAAERAETWRELLAFRPLDRQFQSAVASQALAALEAGGRNEAVAALLRGLQAKSIHAAGDPRLSRFLADRLLSAGRVDDAIEFLEAGLRRVRGDDPMRTALRQRLAVSYEAAGRHRAAEQVYLGLIADRPEEPGHYNDLAYLLAERDEQLAWAESLSHTGLELNRRALRWQVGPRRRQHLLVRAYYLDTLGWIRYRQGRLDEAAELLTEAVDLSARQPHAEVLYHLAQVRFDQGDDEAASHLVQQALQANPEYAPARRLAEQIRRTGPTQRQVI